MNVQNKGWLNGLIGVVIFAGSMPATRLAVMEFSPGFLTGARALIAGIFAVFILFMMKQQRPQSQDLLPLVIIAVGLVLGFPLFTSLALQEISSARALVWLALLPLSTAIFGVFRAAERPSIAFWIFALLGSSIVMSYMLQGDTALHFSRGDLYMILAIIVCGLGYAEGGQLSKRLGGWQVICWVLVTALPFMLLLSFLTFPENMRVIPLSAYLGLIYTGIFSMLIGFFLAIKTILSIFSRKILKNNGFVNF